jgi:glycosyltransferase involved in cell wall biosynthesis
LIYICIPSFNEGTTIGVLLWRIRKVFQNYSREYEILVYDDGSTDETGEVLAPYADVAPLTVLRGEARKGYAHALDTLAREASRRTKYPRRDAMVVMQGDFTDQPELLPELVKKFEGGVDIVIGERAAAGQPAAVKKLRSLSSWALRLSGGSTGLSDPFASFRLYRISLIRDLLKTDTTKPLAKTDGWAANLELLLAALPLARRVERIEVASRYDLRVRPSRIRPLADAMALYRFGRTVRGKQLAIPAQPARTEPGASGPRPGRQKERATS